MFSDEEIKAYKSIKAPDNLREKVLSSCKKASEKSFFNSRKLAYVAACLVAVLGIGFGSRFSGHTPEIFFENIAIESGNVVEIGHGMAAFSRMAPVLSIPLTLEVKNTGKVLVSEGVVRAADGEITEEILNGQGDVVWEIPMADPEKTYELEVTEKNKKLTVSLQYQKETGVWTISRKKN